MPTTCAVGETLTSNEFHNLQIVPDSISVTTEKNSYNLKLISQGLWQGGGVTVKTYTNSDGLVIELGALDTAVKWLQIRWNVPLALDWKYLGDAWERAYGDLEWKHLDAKRIMPWYFLASDGNITHGYGVMTGPKALCYWTADSSGMTLHADVRCGGMGVQLGERKLEVCTVISRRGQFNETPFAAAQAFLRKIDVPQSTPAKAAGLWVQ